MLLFVIALTLTLGLAGRESYLSERLMGLIAMSFGLLDDLNMAIFLDWFASHNTLVIQSLAAIVALLIIFLIFRLFFVPNEEAEAAKNVTYAAVEEKLNKLLEQQASMKMSVAAATEAPLGDALGADAMAALSGDPAAVAAAAAAGATGGEQAAELSRLRAEISTLKDSVKRKEVEIIDAKEQAQKSINTAEADAKLNTLSGKVTDYENEIEALKNRLSDYEIIAEDIADLQAFKKENAELKNQLANQAPVETKVEAKMDSGKIDSEPATDAAAADLLAELEKPKSEEPPAKKAEAAPVAAAPKTEPAPEPEVVEEAAPAVDEAAEGLTAEAPSEKAEDEALPTDFFAAASAAMEEESMPDSVTEDTFPELETYAAKSLDNAEAREVSKGVTREDKNLLDEFEKHFAKDED